MSEEQKKLFEAQLWTLFLNEYSKNVMNVAYSGFEYRVENPSICPHCHKGIEPIHLFNNTIESINYSIWKCTYRECGKQFVAVNKLIFTRNDRLGDFRGFLDGTPVVPYWPETIKNLKSKFIETYTQALHAEYLGLDEISGMGFRKSIEYLVKDYLIQKDELLAGKIEDKLLANVINENFVSPQENDLKELHGWATT
jgi:hypothetical protein